MFRVYITLSLLAVCCPPAAYAGTAPIPPNKQEQVGNLDERLKTESQKQLDLEKQTRNLEVDLKSTRKKLVDTGKSVQENEAALADLEERIAGLEIQKGTLQKTLSQDRHSIANLVLALERIRRVPPEALIAKPEAPLKTAQTAMLMSDIIPVLIRNTDRLRKNIQDLEDVAADLNKKKLSALEKSKALEKENKALGALVESRKKIFARTHEDLEQQQKDVQRISMQAQNLQDLVKRLDENKNAPGKDSKKSASGTSDPSVPDSGQSRLPVSGLVRVHYNDPDAFGAPSKGVSIEARTGALVVAPMGGVVRFAGPFRNYGNMVILEHPKGYHSLIAGLEKIDTVVGQSVSAGEALGYLNRSADSGGKPSLYYELRLNGRPVNPAKKFADLG